MSFPQTHSKLLKYWRGFTLAELLISLAILGVIATFTIPKILNAQQSGAKKAIFRETIAAIANAQHDAILNNQLDKSIGPAAPILNRLNTVKLCNTNAQAQGCWTQAWAGPFNEEQEAGAILHNGATVAGIKPSALTTGNDLIIIDWNGSAAPNLQGDDQLYMALCYDQSGASFNTHCIRNQQDTMNYAPAGNQAAHQALWEWVFQ